MSDCTHETINALDNFWAYDCPSCGRTVSGPTYVTLLREQVTTLKAQREWVSVEERLPEEGQVVVLLDTKHFVSEERSHENVMHVGCYRAFGNYWSVTGERGFTLESFTHWLPLPPAPEGE